MSAAPLNPESMLARAQRLWPNSKNNQRAWLKAVRVAQKSTRGWGAEVPILPAVKTV